ncbi:DUF6119 family protein [Promicromonospora sp. NPDC057138]|uniref:DUF6119 family protein n=1 Tax=Promicromonospora sp. NPDC057138 TaxID=3346031 RepID=UPI0036260C18
MPRERSNTTPRTLYRLVDLPDMHAAVRERYSDDLEFETTAVTVGDREGLLVFGVMATPEAKWAQDVHSLTQVVTPIGNITAAAALLIRRGEDGAWALTFGMGFQLIDQSYVDASFGQRIAIRLADPAKISSVTRSAIDSRAQVARVTVPNGDGLNGFGFEAFGEMATRLVARGTSSGLSAKKDMIAVRGADALNIPLGRTPAELLSDLDHIETILTQEPPIGLGVLEQLVPISKPRTLVSELQDQLAAALADPEGKQLGLAWPFEQIGDNEPPTHFKLVGGGSRKGIQEGLPLLDDLITPLKQTKDPVAKLKGMSVQLFSGDEEAISAQIAARKWLAFETGLNGKRYCFFGGQWFQMDARYAERLLQLAEGVFRKQLDPPLPPWTSQFKEEKDYNQYLALQLGGLCLDRKLVTTDAHPRGFEACDVLLDDGTLVHVKKFDSSAPASHLFAQAYVSTDSLVRDEQAVSALRKKVESLGGDPTWVKDRPPRVVLAMARHKPVTARELFTFSRVNLVRAAQDIESRNVPLFVAPVAVTR